ncbi:MAG TPA: transcriptional repressor LexA [Rubrobacter sp.]|nr:transcriptional repressor LexA [Rubrobacter sp.]
MGEALHPRRVEILRYLARRASMEGPPPSVREIGAAVGLSSSQTVHHHLGRLEEEGYVSRMGRGARTLGLTGKGWEAAGHMALLGRIAAGRGLEAVATDEAYSLAAELLASRSGKRRYLLRVVGQSMVGARIEDGDLLVVEEDESPPDGSIVVVLLREGEEVTVKRFFREGEVLRLRPEAPPGEYEEMVVPAGEVRVQGRVVYVLHPPGRRPGGGIRA